MLPVEAESICPDLLLGRSRREVASLPVTCGRRRRTLGDLFEIDGEGSDEIVVEGDVAHIKRMGQGMSRGRLVVRGSAGAHLGAWMRGGEIEVLGDAGDWLGAHMSGGLIRIHGNAGHHVGARYWGERRGMTGGTIVVFGRVGEGAGAGMRRGLVAVAGPVGDAAGRGMLAGTIVACGPLGARAGIGMRRGTIVCLGSCREMLPTFRYACRFQPVFLRVYLLTLRDLGLPIAEAWLRGYYRRYSGDVNALDKGEILLYDQP